MKPLDTTTARRGTAFSRAWSMPSPETFGMRPVALLLDRWLADAAVIVDPFARNSQRGTVTNDLNPSTSAQHHMPAEDFGRWLVGQGVIADAALFDPPYSPRQIVDCYQSAGLAVSQATTQSARMTSDVRDSLSSVLRPGGIAISCGWNSTGFGKVRGFDLLEILLVAHGGMHNDTIVVVERKASNPSPSPIHAAATAALDGPCPALPLCAGEGPTSSRSTSDALDPGNEVGIGLSSPGGDSARNPYESRHCTGRVSPQRYDAAEGAAISPVEYDRAPASGDAGKRRAVERAGEGLEGTERKGGDRG